MDDWFGIEPDDGDVDARAGEVPDSPALEPGSLWMYAAGTVWDLGPADFDGNGDGVADSIATELDGEHVVLADSDGDGRVDHMTRLDRAGGVVAGELSIDRPEWRPTSLGRLR